MLVITYLGMPLAISLPPSAPRISYVNNEIYRVYLVLVIDPSTIVATLLVIPYKTLRPSWLDLLRIHRIDTTSSLRNNGIRYRLKATCSSYSHFTLALSIERPYPELVVYVVTAIE